MNPTPTEKLQEMKNQEEQMKRLEELKKEQEAKILQIRETIKNKIYPFIRDNSVDYEDAQSFAQVFTMSLQQAFQLMAKTVTVADLKLEDHVKKGPESLRFLQLLEEVKDMTVSEAVSAFEGIPNLVERAVQEKLAGTTLVDLKTDELVEKIFSPVPATAPAEGADAGGGADAQ